MPLLTRFRCVPLFLLSALLATPASADATSISPASGPTAGGTEVTVKGNFGTWQYGVLFDGAPAVTTTRVDEHTLVAITPAHLPGTTAVGIFEYDIFLGTNLTFTFTGQAEDGLERVLLPIFTPPVHGAFGSEFRTAFRAWYPGGGKAFPYIYGIEEGEREASRPILVGQYSGVVGTRLPINYTGAPGRFIYLPKGDFDLLATHLRVFDVSRDAESFGTELPIVRSRELLHSAVALAGVPTDPRFRNTLRTYSTAATTVRVTFTNDVGFASQTRTIDLPAGRDAFEPAYAVYSDFPSDVGELRVKVEPLSADAPPIWAFISVTNNTTEQITTITPQR